MKGGSAGYCGKGRKLAIAITCFAERYADLTDHDHAAFTDAIAAGEISAAPVSER